MNDSAVPAPNLCDRDLPHDVRRDLFGGKGMVRVWSLTSAPALPFTAVLACELEAGGSVGTHVQEQFPEIVIGISGSGSANVNGVPATLRAGDVVQLALGHTLSIVNDSNDIPLSYLIIKAQSLGAAR
jgi:quercetin dioxygenase-like cupin family protein